VVAKIRERFYVANECFKKTTKNVENSVPKSKRRFGQPFINFYKNDRGPIFCKFFSAESDFPQNFPRNFSGKGFFKTFFRGKFQISPEFFPWKIGPEVPPAQVVV
jgi:hypothetical protein